MPTIVRLGRSALAAGFVLAAHAAAAAEFGSLIYPPQAVFPFGAATVNTEIRIPDDDPGVHGFYMNLVLPPDYKTDSWVRISLYLTTSVAKPCNIVFDTQVLTRWRPGVAPKLNSSGLAPADGNNTVAFPNNNAVVKKVFLVKLDPAFPGGQRPGDALRIGLGRDPGHLSDTCNGAVQVPAIDVRYVRAP